MSKSAGNNAVEKPRGGRDMESECPGPVLVGVNSRKRTEFQLKFDEQQKYKTGGRNGFKDYSKDCSMMSVLSVMPVTVSKRP